MGGGTIYIYMYMYTQVYIYIFLALINPVFCNPESPPDPEKLLYTPYPKS